MHTTQSNHDPSRTSRIRSLAKSDPDAAILALQHFLTDTFQLAVQNVQINYDQYSLNSLNGFFNAGDRSYFFKFHQEEGEEDMKGEYYRADLLANAGLPVDLPVWKSTQPGEQILVYNRRNDKRFSDVLRDLDEHPDARAIARVGTAERELNEKILAVAISTLQKVDEKQVAEEPIHHLFYERMIDPKSCQSPGGRYAKFYVDKQFDFTDCSLTWNEFSTATIVLNGQRMLSTFGEIFANALTHLNPKNLTAAGGYTAHGDAHNANVWYVDKNQTVSLSYFDPAFAGLYIPSLIAEVKATFHNVFAHPYWLYEPDVAQSYFNADVVYQQGELWITTDWQLSDVRRELLEIKIDSYWKPFLRCLAEQNMLPPDWEAAIRSALAMCPLLVMNLRSSAERHNLTSSAIGFFVAGLAGSRPETGQNIISQFFDDIDPSKRA